MHGEHQRRGQPRQQQSGRLVAHPVAHRSAPAQRQDAVEILADLGIGAIAKRAQIRDHADVPEDDGDGGVSGDREDVPHQRRAELRPDRHRVGIRKQPVTQPGTAYVDHREHAGADHGKDGHGLGEAADRVAPSLLEEQQNRGDQRARVADADPPNEVDDRKSPAHRLRHAPDADALKEQPGERHHQQGGPYAAYAEKGKPAQRRARRQHDARDLFGDRPEGLPRRNHAVFAGRGIDPRRACRISIFQVAVCHRGSNPLPARVPPAPLRVPGSDSTPRPHTWSADAYSDRPAPGSCAGRLAASLPG